MTAEDHSIIGGLGGAVAEVLGEHRPTRMKRIGIQDRFGESGPTMRCWRNTVSRSTTWFDRALELLGDQGSRMR